MLPRAVKTPVVAPLPYSRFFSLTETRSALESITPPGYRLGELGPNWEELTPSDVVVRVVGLPRNEPERSARLDEVVRAGTDRTAPNEHPRPWQTNYLRAAAQAGLAPEDVLYGVLARDLIRNFENDARVLGEGSGLVLIYDARTEHGLRQLDGLLYGFKDPAHKQAALLVAAPLEFAR